MSSRKAAGMLSTMTRTALALAPRVRAAAGGARHPIDAVHPPQPIAPGTGADAVGRLVAGRPPID